MKRFLIFLVMFITLFSFGNLEEENLELSEAELNELLIQMIKEENEGSEYLVLPPNVEVHDNKNAQKGFSYKLLLLGIDTHQDDIKGRADTIMIASIDNNKLKLISFMRDSYVQIPGRGHNKINAAYAFGEAGLLIEALKKNFDVDIDGYIAVNFALMRELVDEIGGVYVDVLPEELKSLNAILEYYNRVNKHPKNQEKLPKAGYQKLTGLQAMSYARIRKMDSDYERVGRQQRVMSAIFQQLKQKSLDEIIEVISKYISRVKTDVTASDAFDLAGEVLSLQIRDIKYLRVPIDGARSSKMINGTYYIVPNYIKNADAIKEFLSAD